MTSGHLWSFPELNTKQLVKRTIRAGGKHREKEKNSRFFAHGFFKHDSTKSRVNNESNNDIKRKLKETSTTRNVRVEKHKGVAEREKNTDAG